MRHELPCFANVPRALPLLFCFMLTVGCGRCDGDGPTTAADAPPEVVSITPANNARVNEVPEISIRFSEPMQRAFGDVTISPGDTTLEAADGTWSMDDEVLTFANVGPFEPGRVYTIGLSTSFRDKANNELEVPFGSRFEIVETTPPRVSSTIPGLGMPVGEITRITLVFNEPMDTSTGSVAISEPGEITRATWENSTRHVLTLGPLEGSTTYTLTLADFVGLDGLALDARDTEFEFTTQFADPRVVSARPAEGEREVVAADTRAIEIDFSRPVTARLEDLSLTDDFGESVELARIDFEQEGRRMILELGSELFPGRDYRLDLNAVSGADGSMFDASRYLGDGVLDFTTTLDATTPPRVLATDPVEGAQQVSTSLARIDVVFDQRMDTSITSARLESGNEQFDLDGMWDGDALRIAFVLTEPLSPSTTYSLDLSELRSDGGQSIGPAQSSTNGLTLDFTTREASGERCIEALGEADATMGQDGALTWVLAAEDVTGLDHDFTCDTSGFGPDAVIRYEKTTESLSNGGALLSVNAASTKPLDLSITSGDCEAGAVEACRSGRASWSSTLDVGPGVYHVWVAPALIGESFAETTITVDELEAFPVGESCAAPFDANSPNYQPPATEQDPHQWLLPAGSISSIDAAPDARIRCNALGSSGVDAIIAFDKQSADSVLDIDVRAMGQGAEDDRVHVMVMTDCLMTADASRCQAGDEVALESIEAPAGPVFIGISLDQVNANWPDVEVDVREVNLGAGESCATAIPALPGSNSVQGTSTESRSVPGCFASDAQVEWYRFTLTEDTIQVVSDMADAGIAVVSPGTSRALACSRDATSSALDVLGQVGDEVCVAIEQGPNVSAVTQFEVQSTPAPDGSTCANAIPLLEGANPINATSGRRYNAPVCLPAGEDVTWYSFTATGDIVRLSALGANLALRDAQTGRVLGCSDERLGRRVNIGDSFCVALSGNASEVILANQTYDGVQGTPTKLAVTLPAQANGQPRNVTGDRWMVADDERLYMLHYATPADVGILEVPLTGGASTLYGPNQGVATTTLGYAATVADGVLYSLDDSAGDTRLYSLSRVGASYSSQVQDTGSSYAVGPARAIAASTNRLYTITHRAPIVVFEHPLASNAPASEVARLQSMTDVTGLVADNGYLYIAGRSVSGEEGIFRLPRALLGAPMPTPILIAEVDLDLAFITPMALDADSNPDYLYYRTTSPQQVGVIASPASSGNVLDLGPIASVGDSGDHAMAYDQVNDRLVLFASENGSPGEFYVIER